jgi:hypothetical protein
MKYARFNGLTVIELFTVPTGFTINDCFHADVVAQFERVADDVTIGYVKPEAQAIVVEEEAPVTDEQTISSDTIM